MPLRPLALSTELYETFLGALLTVCRSDDVANETELEALRQVAREIAPNAEFDPEALLFSDVTPEALAQAVAGRDHGPFRTPNALAPDDIARAFMQAAARIAKADGMLGDNEMATLRRFAAALGLPADTALGWK